MEELQSLYEKAAAGKRDGWAYLSLSAMIRKNGEALTREYLTNEIAIHTKRDESGFHSGHFSINGEGHYPGYTTLRTWNGWATPCFEKEVADKIAKDTVENSAPNSLCISYSEKHDAYIVRCVDQDSEPEFFGGSTIQTPDGQKHVYALGSCSWIWDEDEEQKED